MSKILHLPSILFCVSMVLIGLACGTISHTVSSAASEDKKSNLQASTDHHETTSGSTQVTHAVFLEDAGDQRPQSIGKSNLRNCQVGNCQHCGQFSCGCGVGNPNVPVHGHVAQAAYHQATTGTGEPVKFLAGVNQNTITRRSGEPGWQDATPVPWEAFAYGEYIGPHRAPHVADYRLRVDDQLEFVYILTREKSTEPYRFYTGDTISITDPVNVAVNQPQVAILGDGTISLGFIGQVRVAGKTISDLQRELNDRYRKFFVNPSVVVQVISGDTPLRDLLDSVDARQGQGGQSREATVSPDGTIQLPLVGSVPAIGLTLEEVAREVNARYRQKIRGIEVTPVLTQRAPRFVYVVGEVAAPGQFALTGPTSAMQAIALAGGFELGGNLRQVIVFRRDENWKLTATKLDLAGALFGRKPYPSDEIWLRDSDIVLVPKRPIQRLSEQVNLYLTNTVYSIFPQQGVAFNFDGFTSL